MTVSQYIVTVRLSLLPPSVNSAYVTNKSGKGRGRFKSAAYKAWETLSGHELNIQKPGHVAGAYAATYVFGRKNKRSDLGNLEKLVSDLLVAHRVVEDDALAQEIRLSWGPVEGVYIQVCSTKERGA